MERQGRPKKKKQTFGERSRERIATRYLTEDRNVFFAGQINRRINFEFSTDLRTSWEICLSYPIEFFGW